MLDSLPFIFLIGRLCACKRGDLSGFQPTFCLQHSKWPTTAAAHGGKKKGKHQASRASDPQTTPNDPKASMPLAQGPPCGRRPTHSAALPRRLAAAGLGLAAARRLLRAGAEGPDSRGLGEGWGGGGPSHPNDPSQHSAPAPPIPLPHTLFPK